MNKIDEIIFFLNKAITNVSEDRKYFIDKIDKTLFCMVPYLNGYKLHIKNKNVLPSRDKIIYVERTFQSKLLNNMVEEIPKIPFFKKNEFLEQFLATVEDSNLYNDLSQEKKLVDDKSDLLNVFSSTLQNHKKVAYKYSLKLGGFLNEQVQCLLPFANIDDLTVIW
ncbi:hypothetical protein PN465_15710 [Nodularia spumigena CS-584]|nr:hypothetical protein [Nodularia spumigena]MDB9383651.1 hypothetical protein [Nodularia spumigena CS-584]